MKNNQLIIYQIEDGKVKIEIYKEVVCANVALTTQHAAIKGNI